MVCYREKHDGENLIEKKHNTTLSKEEQINVLEYWFPKNKTQEKMIVRGQEKMKEGGKGRARDERNRLGR